MSGAVAVADPGARIAWRGALFAALLNAVGSPIELAISHGAVALPRWPPICAGSVGLMLVAILWWRRDRPTRSGAAAAFLGNTAAVVVMLWIDNSYWAALGQGWAPFQANKLGAITVGLLTPELGVGIASIAAYAGSAVAQWALFAPPVRATLARGEPLATCVFALFGVIILVVAGRRYAAERRLVEQQQEAAALERLARAFLAVRDFANTPLQTIESATAVARMLHPEAETQLAQIERALARLRRLNRVLSRHEAHIQWKPGDESFDAIARLEQVTDK